MRIQWDPDAGTVEANDAWIERYLRFLIEHPPKNGVIGDPGPLFLCADPAHDAADFMAALLVKGAIISRPEGLGSEPPSPLPSSDEEMALRDAGFSVLN